MIERSRDGIGVPPTPDAPVPSYYRYSSPNEDLWLYYNGETWVGEPRALPWYLRPVPWARGRTQVYVILLFLGGCLVAVTVYLLTR